MAGEKNHSKVINVNFRNKKDFGWREHVESLLLDNGKMVHSKVFRVLFYGHNILRPSCYECPFKSTMHPGDITIADYWGIAKAAPEFDDNKGVSLVLINNCKGKEFFDSIENDVNRVDTKIEDSMQQPLIGPFPKPIEREQFWKDFYNRSFNYIAKKYGGAGIADKIKGKVSIIKRKYKKKNII